MPPMPSRPSRGERPPAVPPLPARKDYGGGCYRRSIRTWARDDEVTGELADDFHHFAVRLRHDGERIVAVEGEDVRVPWTTCPGAVAPLRQMAGARIAAGLLALQAHTPARTQCTHLHDLACLAAAHAWRARGGGAASRRLDVAVPDRAAGVTRASLSCDGVVRLEWEVRGSRVVGCAPGDFAGASLAGREFAERLASLGDPDAVEAAFVLRRALFIATGRRHDFEAMERASEFAPVVGAACHTFAPERVDEARRVHGTVRDFSDSARAIFERRGPSR